MRVIDKVYCINDYWLDYPRTEKIQIAKTGLTENEIKRMLEGETISKSDRGGTYRQYFRRISEDYAD